MIVYVFCSASQIYLKVATKIITFKYKLSITTLREQIRDRYLIYEKNMYQIEMSKCYAVSSQLAVESVRGGVGISSREAYSLTKNTDWFRH